MARKTLADIRAGKDVWHRLDSGTDVAAIGLQLRMGTVGHYWHVDTFAGRLNVDPGKAITALLERGDDWVNWSGMADACGTVWITVHEVLER